MLLSDKKSHICMAMEVQDLAFCVCPCNWQVGLLLLRAEHQQCLPAKEMCFSICVKRPHLSVEAVYWNTYDIWPICKQYSS